MRYVYFSFHYADIWRVNQIRKSGIVFGPKSIGFVDRSLWEKARAKNEAALKRLIEGGLEGTSVTAVLIGQRTASRRWVTYEIKRSIERGNAVLGVHINGLRDHRGGVANQGRVPALLRTRRAAIHAWSNAKDLGDWVEEAWKAQNEEPGLLEKLARWLG